MVCKMTEWTKEDESKYKKEMARPEKVMKSLSAQEWNYLILNREVVDAIKKYKASARNLDKILDKIK